MNNLAVSENIVALCDLDLKRCAGTIKQFPKAELFTDFRVMLEKRKDIDAVLIATPDHSHAYIAMACMRAGKHVYVQKPMCWSVFEARHLAKQAAANPKIVTQMGNQGHSTDDARRGQDYLAAGAIGDVTDRVPLTPVAIREGHALADRLFGKGPARPIRYDTTASVVFGTPELGAVGMTGWAAGPHLHFEVRFRGAAQNPARFLRQCPNFVLPG